MEKAVVLFAYEPLRPLLDPARERFPRVEFHFCEPSAPAVLRALRPDSVAMAGVDFPPPGASVQGLRWFHLLSSGYDFLLGRPLPNPKIAVTNSSGAYAGGMAEFVLMRLLMHAKRAYSILEAQQQRSWNRMTLAGRTIEGKSLVVIGNGAVGREVGRMARALGMRVQVLGRARQQELPAAVSDADYVVLATSLNPTTRGLMNKELFERMKNRPYLVNISRGAIMNTDDLIEAVRAGVLAGAALDVFEEEPLPPTSPLYDVEGIAISPHVSGVFRETDSQLIELFCDNLERFLNGRPLRNRIERSLRRSRVTDASKTKD